VVVGAVGAALAAALAPSAAAQTQPVFVNGQAQVVPAFSVSSEWIRHRLWVETEFDTDGDGRRDRVHVDVTRPAQTDSEGLKVPVIYESSPYYAGTSSTAAQYLWNVNHELGEPPPPRLSAPPIGFNPNRTSISNSEVNTWVPRGFAVIHSESPGTGLSQGCPTVGAPNESLAPKAVVDWLNGRAKGYTTADGDVEVQASWATGKVGMTGTSYNGTLPLAAATTGVAGLEAIIPIAPNTSYYHYYRSNGLVRNPGGWVGEDIDFLFDYINSGDPARRQYCIDTVREGVMKVHQDRVTGDYNDFWAGRDYLNQLDNVKAATLMAHAFNDWNVVPEHSVRIAEALKGKVPLQQYYHQGGHGGAPPLGLRNRWFTRYLYGIQNGVENDPKAWVTREAAACPPRTAAVVGDQSATATLTVADASALQVGMTLTVPQTNETGTITNTTRAILSIPNSTTVVLDSAVATATGQKVADGAVVSITCSSANPTPYRDYPNPAAKPVDFLPRAGGNATGELTPLTRPVAGAETLVDDVSCQPGNFAGLASAPQRLLYATPTLTAPLHLSGTPRIKVRMAASKAAANLSVWLTVLPFTPSVNCTSTSISGSQSHVITRGWADPQNRGAITGGSPLVPGEFVDVTFNLQPTDKVVQAGQRLGLMVFSSDRLFTLRPQPGTQVTVDLASTSLRLPVVGGRLALGVCADPDERATVVIGGVDSHVPNRTLAGTCTINDHILELQPWPSHGAFMDHLTELADELLEAGVVSAEERDAILSAGENSTIGGDEEEAEVGATVPPTLSLALGSPVSFGTFTPGVEREYTASTNATVISTAGDATLTASDPSSTAPGHLVNGSFSLPQPLRVAGSTLPATVKTYAAPVSNDVVTVDFSQSIATTDALRTGTYAKTLTFTLSTTSP
jgi:predicted acyl esterase